MSKYVVIFVFFFFFPHSFSSLYQPLCLVCLLQVPGIPLATGKQQDCLLYLVTIATGLECEAIMAALCWAEARPAAWTEHPCGCQAGPWLPAFVLFAHCTCGFSLLLFSGALIYWERCLLLSAGGWLFLLEPAELEGSADFHSLPTYSCFARGILPDFNWSGWCYLGSTCRFLRL